MRRKDREVTDFKQNISIIDKCELKEILIKKENSQ